MTHRFVEPVWTLYLRDATLARQGQIEEYASFETVLRYNDVSTWTLELDARHALVPQIIQPGAGILLVRGGTVVMSGPWTRLDGRADGNHEVLTVTGASDEVLLREAQASPVPSASSPPYSAQEHDVRTGIASTVLRQYVDANAGPGAVSTRRKLGLTIGTDTLVGSTVTGRARWQVLLTLLQDLATSGGVGFRVVQVDQGREFQVYQPQDKSSLVKFSTALGTLSEFSHTTNRPTATYVYVAGGGEGTARVVRERASSQYATWGRIEGELVDQRHTSVTTELDQAGDEELIEQGQRTTLAVTPIDTDQQRFGEHYDLGDIVSADLGAFGQVSDLMREVTVSLRPESQRITPALGTTLTVPPLFEALRRTRHRVINLERR